MPVVPVGLYFAQSVTYRPFIGLLLDYSFGLVEAVFVAPRSEELGIATL